MVESPAQGGWVIALSFALAFLFTVLPIPTGLMWARPEWVSLVLIYWVIALPQRVGVMSAFFAGLLLDALEGSMLGQNALALSVVAYLALILYQRLRQFNMMQQAAVVFVLVGIDQIVSAWVQNIDGASPRGVLILMPVLMSALLWPAVTTSLRHSRRRFSVS